MGQLPIGCHCRSIPLRPNGMEPDEKEIPEALLDLMEDYAIIGDEASAKECLAAYLKIMEEKDGTA